MKHPKLKHELRYWRPENEQFGKAGCPIGGEFVRASEHQSVTVISHVPTGLPQEQREKAVEEAARDMGISEPFQTLMLEDRQATGVNISFVGDLDELLASIAREGRRITDQSDAGNYRQY